jgi:hypothetical protein
VKRKKPLNYEVILRRDIQQVARIRLVASSRQEAINVANFIGNDAAWEFEEYLGAHEPEVKIQRVPPIKGRLAGKCDRRTNTDRRATKRRLGDKSRALVAARTKRSRA